MGGARIELDGVTKRYGGQLALDAVSLRVAAGEFLALVGPSGSGKTTLLQTINRLIEPDAGRLRARRRAGHGADGRAVRRAVLEPQRRADRAAAGRRCAAAAGAAPLIGKIPVEAVRAANLSVDHDQDKIAPGTARRLWRKG
jgi:ABC-type cobalamin/Fe3+-siderophores transport system ATPase subunit